MQLSAGQRTQFQKTVLDYYRAHGRHDLPWRQPRADGSFDPYAIIVSEVMLQQTQVGRVIPKYRAFMERFPSLDALAAAPLAEVLQAWSGLGYNRRAKFLQQAAQAIVAHDGSWPRTTAELARLPGIGTNTAGALLAYAYDMPVVFIETNVRTVFIHHFFADEPAVVQDRAIADLVAATLPDNPRQWYWAVMDYGTHLKQVVGNVSQKSAHYVRQSSFAGSRRQIRGKIIRLLSGGPQMGEMLAAAIPDERRQAVLDDLLAEGLIDRRDDCYMLHGACYTESAKQ